MTNSIRVLKITPEADAIVPESMWIADQGDGTYRNPILYTDYSDPDAIRVGEDYFMIASSFCNAPAIPLLHSRDLVNWRVMNYVCDHIPEARYKAPIHGCGVWAPSIRYHEGTYYVCFPMPDEGIYMTTSTDPWGKWSEPVNIRPGAGWIDPCPFWDEDGRAYLVAGVAKSRIGYKSVLHMVEMQPDGLGLIGEEVKIFDGNENDQVTIEGPKMYKRDGWYYIFAPAGGVKTGWQTVLRARKPFGPYEYKVVMRQGSSHINGPHQGAWVDTPSGEDWFLHFQDVYAAGRIVHLQPMSWKDDWPIIGVAQNGNEYGEPVTEYRKPDIRRSEQITSDDFTGATLGLQWQWNANPDNWYRCSSQGLYLDALSTEGRPLGDMPNLLLQKWPAPEFQCVIKLDVSGLKCGAAAGIVSMGMHYGAVGVERRQDGSLALRLYDGTQTFHQEKAATVEQISSPEWEPLKGFQGNEVYFLYQVKLTGTRDINEQERNTPIWTTTLSISLDGSHFAEQMSFEAVAGRWVGVKNGIFCISRNQEGGGCLAKYVKYFPLSSPQRE